MVDSAGSPHASPYGGLVRYRRIQAVRPLGGPYGVPGALPPDSAGSPRASPYNGSPIRGAIGGLRYLWYSNSME